MAQVEVEEKEKLVEGKIIAEGKHLFPRYEDYTHIGNISARPHGPAGRQLRKLKRGGRRRLRLPEIIVSAGQGIK